jgi:CopA family copper-resistance protein
MPLAKAACLSKAHRSTSGAAEKTVHQSGIKILSNEIELRSKLKSENESGVPDSQASCEGQRHRVPGLSRRRFVQGMLAGGVIASVDLWRWPGGGVAAPRETTELVGTQGDLVIDKIPVNFTGALSSAIAVNGSVPGPLLRWRENDTVNIAVTNRLAVDTSIHWHGVRVPANMDGVPGLSFPGIHPDQTFTYHFPIRQRGTYWYHSHSGFQEQTGLYGPLIIDPSGPDPISYDREYIIMLSDWTGEDPDVVFANLKMQSDYYNYNQRTAGTFLSNVGSHGLGPTISDRLLWGRMNMSPTDLSDMSGATYTYLVNGHPPAANWTGLFRPRGLSMAPR